MLVTDRHRMCEKSNTRIMLFRKQKTTAATAITKNNSNKKKQGEQANSKQTNLAGETSSL